MYDSGEVEFDSVCNADLPLSETNLFRQKTMIPEKDSEKIKNILSDLGKYELKDYYSPPEKWKIVDVSNNTEVIFAESTGKNRRMELLGNIV